MMVRRRMDRLWGAVAVVAALAAVVGVLAGGWAGVAAGAAGVAAAGGGRPGARISGPIRVVTVAVQQLRGQRVPGKPVTARAKIARIVSLVNHLPVLKPGTYACPADRGPHLLLGFLRTPAARPVARVDADASGCGVVTIAVRGRPLVVASGGRGLVRALAGIGAVSPVR